MDIQEHQGGDHDHNNQDQAMADEAVLDHTNTRSQPLPPPLPLPADGDEETFNSFNVSADSSLEYPSADGTADEEVCDLTDDGASSPLLNRGNVKAKSAQQKADSRAAARKRMLHFGQFGQRSTMVEAEKRRREDSAVENAVAGKKKKPRGKDADQESNPLLRLPGRLPKSYKNFKNALVRRAPVLQDDTKATIDVLRSLGRPFEKTLASIVDYATGRLDLEKDSDGVISEVLELEKTWTKAHKESLGKMVAMLERLEGIPFGEVEDES